MRFLNILLLLLCLLLPASAFSEQEGMDLLTPVEMAASEDAQTLDLYCGPTQGFYRHEEQTLDLGQPYVFFGQYDCWAMVAQGTAEQFGPVGWVEAGSLAAVPYEPQLGFENGFAATVEDTAALTDNPLADDPFGGWTFSLAPGAPITVLAQYGDWLYVQATIEDTPVRAFIAAKTVL